MAFDLFQSRRNCHERCLWWVRNESDDYESDELVYKRIPDGMFYAKEVSAETTDNNIIGGVAMIDRSNVTIESADDLMDIQRYVLNKINVMVKYQDDFWRVESMQRRKSKIQNSEFANSNNVSHYWYLNLVK